MDNSCNAPDYNVYYPLVSEFCEIILTKKDKIEFEKVKNFFASLSDEQKKSLNGINKDLVPKVRSIIFDKIIEYIKDYHNPTQFNFGKPFEFDSAGEYEEFCDRCRTYYQNENLNHNLPDVFDFIFQYIHEMSDHYRIFVYFYDVRSVETANTIIQKMESVAYEQTEQAVKTATQNLAKQQVEEQLGKQMPTVTEKISESSVTILGIFSGIVLTIVAGLFYSSSVLESINSADFYKLICISALVGLVCLYLIAIMFRFVARIGEKEDKKFFSDWLIIAISVVLIIIMVASFMQYLKSPNQTTPQKAETTDFSANIDVNISYNESTTNDTAEDLMTEETSNILVPETTTYNQ